MVGKINPYDDTESIIQSLSLDDSLLDILIEIEDELDKAHIYAYENWKQGVVCKGPKITRHWVDITLRYPYEKMPDPEACFRLAKMNVRVKYEKSLIDVMREVKSMDDIDPMTGEPIIDEVMVWYLHCKFPREMVENIKPTSDIGLLPVDQPPEDPMEEEMDFGP